MGTAIFKTVRVMEPIDHEHPAAFIAAAKRLGITTVVIAWQDEYGQVPDVETINYQRLRLLRLVAYQRSGGALLRCCVTGGSDERAALRRELEAAGFRVEERSRNIVGFET